MQHDLIQFGDSSIEFFYVLRGDTPLVCFHGYGESAGSFSFLEHALPQKYSIFAINLPFHGKTDWKEKNNLTPAGLTEIIKQLLQRHFYNTYPSGKKMILTGYSLGGRVALSLYEQIPGEIQKLVLLAPDGLMMNPWYWLATQTLIGNRLFAYTMKKPGWFFGLLKGLQKTGLVNASIFKFVNYYIGDAEVRQQLYIRWTTLRQLKPDLKKIKTQIRQHNTAVRLIYGLHDRIIRTSVGNRFIKGIEAQSHLIVIHAGHQVLHEKHVKEILPALLH